MTGSRLVAFGLVFAMLTVLPAGAQSPGSVPRVVRFDGQAAAGAAGPRTATLAVFDAATGGAPLWQETQLVQVGPDGRFAVLVGAGQAEGLPSAVLASSDPRWLEVRFDGEPAMARALLTSVPYALRAADADTLGGLPASAFLRTPERAGTGGGTSAPTAGGDLDRPTVNTGTTGYIGKFTNAIDLTSSVMFENAGRIGVGTATPQDALSVRFSDPNGVFAGYAVQNLSSSPTSYSGMLFYDQNGVLGQFQGFNNTTHEYRINNIATGGSINFMIGSNPRFTVTAGGVGIGTTVPSDSLEVPIGWIRTGSGLRMFGNSRYSGVSQEAGNALVNLGMNDGRTGTFNASTMGGLFRVDIRLFQPLFQWWRKAAISGIETSLMSLDFTGVLTVPGARGHALTASPVAVMIDAAGELGIMSSSRRYKDDIRDMGDASTGLMALRPVTYHYRSAGAGAALEYGLVAEEVAEVYPDLVARLGDGTIETVQYHKVNAMLLNEVQKQYRRIEAQDERLAAQQRALDAQSRQLEALQRLLSELQSARATAPSTPQR